MERIKRKQRIKIEIGSGEESEWVSEREGADKSVKINAHMYENWVTGVFIRSWFDLLAYMAYMYVYTARQCVLFILAVFGAAPFLTGIRVSNSSSERIFYIACFDSDVYWKKINFLLHTPTNTRAHTQTHTVTHTQRIHYIFLLLINFYLNFIVSNICTHHTFSGFYLFWA